MLGREGSGPDSTMGVEASGREPAVWVGVGWGFHQCRPCTPLLRGAGSQSPRRLGPWAELWPQKGGLREEGATGGKRWEQDAGLWGQVWHSQREETGVWPPSPLNPGAPTLIPSGPPGEAERRPAGCWGAGTHGFTRVSRCQAVGLEGGRVGFRAGEVGVAGCCQGCVRVGRPGAPGPCGRVGSGTPWGRGVDRPRDDVFFEMGV